VSSRRNGLTLVELLELPRTELLTRVLPDGRTEEAIRLPIDACDEDRSGG
jgi:hypothetical protein